MKEKWKHIVGYRGVYKISNLGKILSFNKNNSRGRIIKYPTNSKGYFTVGLSYKGIRKMYLVHRNVCGAFCKKRKNRNQVNHKDGNKLNNHASNLEWVTPRENTPHTMNNGLMNNSGERNYNSKLTKQDVVLIKNLIRNKATNIKIAKLFNIDATVISRIKTGKIWKN